MKTYNYADLDVNDIKSLCQRPKLDFDAVAGQVQPIIDDVINRGDEAVLDFTEKFDGVRPDSLFLNPQEHPVEIDPEIKEAVDTAYENIYRFHKAQLPMPLEVETMPGVRCMRQARPIELVGLYVPGGTAILPSTALMLGIPAQLAGCHDIILATPPREDGTIHPVMLYIAQKIEASGILKSGGAQAIAAMAHGTQTIPKVDKLFGPGNQYVTTAKMILQNSDLQVSIDMPAGPSEVLVIADETANPAYVASDLLSQAEHGVDSQVVLVATPDFPLEQLEDELAKQCSQLPRQKIAEQALEHSFTLLVETMEQALFFSNAYAPEHLIIQSEDPESYIGEIYNAGSVFLGPWSPESVGDYASGTNHTLPTYGYARMYSGISVDSFLKYITFQNLSKEGLQKVGPAVEKLAHLENLQAHKNAVTLRLEDIQ